MKNVSKGFKSFWFLNYLSCHNYGIACFWQFLRSKFQICGKPVTWIKVSLFPATEFDSQNLRKCFECFISFSNFISSVTTVLVSSIDVSFRGLPFLECIRLRDFSFCSWHQNLDSAKFPRDAFALDLYLHAKTSLTATTRCISSCTVAINDISHLTNISGYNYPTHSMKLISDCPRKSRVLFQHQFLTLVFP